MCRLFESFIALPRTSSLWGGAVNLGADGDNYTVREIAELAVEAVPEARLSFVDNPSKDERSYKVSFQKLSNYLQDYARERCSMRDVGNETARLVSDSIAELGFNEFQTRTTRLNYLQRLADLGFIDENLRWK